MTAVQNFAAPSERQPSADLPHFFDYCPWRFRAWATDAERAAQAAHQATLTGSGAARIGPDCFVSPLAGVYPRALVLGARSYVAAYAYVTDEVTTGDDCTLNPYAVVRGRVRMGSGVRIGAHASIIGFNHGFADPHTPVFQQAETVRGIEIGDDVWIGSSVTILDGVRVGSHTILAAGAVVTRDVPDYAVVGGSPARILKSRLGEPVPVGRPVSAPARATAAPDPHDLNALLAAFGSRVAAQWPDVLRTCANTDPHAGAPTYLPQPGQTPSVRATCDAIEIAAMFGALPELRSREEFAAQLHSYQDPHTGLYPDPWHPPAARDNPWHLTDHLSRYHLLAVGYALELLGEAPRHPVHAVARLDAAALTGLLEGLPWTERAWSAGDWIDGYGTGLYLNARNFAGHAAPGAAEALHGWLLSRADPASGLWGTPGAQDGWLQPVNGFYRLTRGTFAQFGLPVPYPDAATDTLLRHARDTRFFSDARGNACNVLDVIHPLWLCGRQTTHRADDVQAWAQAQLRRILPRWVDGRGFAFELPAQPGATPASQPGLQGTEMWLSTAYLLAEVLGRSEHLGYRPRGVHRLEPALTFPRAGTSPTRLPVTSPGA
ncbi:acyltransferase [Deinococcus knuensis]|uniref:Acyltransferase n=1 Tax=Deinococcus knuensis TaxID=1837380 RepID=A0ABQ2SW27_9DEIO|nr:acyltransferase [Deinococcus knuensis]GGS39930.1 hypothetical protein GCM10008961_34130 [Deinococcus knuensis]